MDRGDGPEIDREFPQAAFEAHPETLRVASELPGCESLIPDGRGKFTLSSANFRAGAGFDRGRETGLPGMVAVDRSFEATLALDGACPMGIPDMPRGIAPCRQFFR